jgi:hypothetical protein
MSFAAIAIGLSAVGAGVSFIGQMQQAKAAQGIANANAALQQQNSQMEAATLRAQAEIQKNTAAQNLRLRQQEAGARFENANVMRQRALAQDEINAANIRKKREEYGRMQATQVARYAAAGIVESTGSPLSLIAETAGIIARDIGEQTYADNLRQQGLLREASLERLGGEFALAGATLDYSSELSASKIRESSAAATLLTGQRQSEITRLAGASQASVLRTGAFGGLLGSGTNLLTQHLQFKQWGAYG